MPYDLFQLLPKADSLLCPPIMMECLVIFWHHIITFKRIAWRGRAEKEAPAWKPLKTQTPRPWKGAFQSTTAGDLADGVGLASLEDEVG